MMKRTGFTTGILSLAFLAGMVSCAEEENGLTDGSGTVNEEMTETMVQTEGETELETVFEFVEDEMAILAEGAKGGTEDGRRGECLVSECATVTHDAEARTVEIDFGTENCAGRDGKYRRGKIIVSYDGEAREPGATKTVTLEDYYINDNLLTGTKVVVNVTGEDGLPSHLVTVSDASFTNEEGTAYWNSQRTITRTEGLDTRVPFDDVIMVEGSSWGRHRTGVEFTLEITSPLKRVLQKGCARTFVAGELTYENENGRQWVLNYDPYGDEACDRVAEVTAGEETKTITLR